MKKLKAFWKKFNNSGYDEPIYTNYRRELILQNTRMVRTTSFIGSLIMSLLTIISLIMPSVSRVRPLYGATAVMFIVICVVSSSSKAMERKGIVTLLCNYGFLTVAFIFAIGLDIIQKSVTATTVCVLLVSLPLLIVDVPWREMLYFLVITGCFSYESVFIKQSPKASIDVLNAVSFFIVGVFLGYRHNQMVLRNIRGQRLLEKQRDTDALTSLYNKAAVEREAVEYLKTRDAVASLIVMDMDNFKYLNDTYGHHAGDEILASIGKLLTEQFRSSDIVSRFGGDEFVVFLPETNNKDIIGSRVQKILDGLGDIHISADPDYRAQMCIGIATCPDDGTDYEELFRNADEAMYHVKRNGKNGYEFYDAAVKAKILVVDDVEINRAILVQTLKNEYEVLEAVDGCHALQVLDENKDMALVITDVQMPNMDGMELIKKIRQNPEYKEVAIIANTQYGDIEQEGEIFKMGIDDFIYKAVSPQVIHLRVKNVLHVREER